MTYGNYAPFYRTGYFNPVQPPVMSAMADVPNQYGQNYQQPMQTQQMPFTDMLWVLNETEATSYPVAPNNRVILWDKNSDTVYIKSVNAQGVPSMEILDYTRRVADNATKTPENHVCKCQGEFVRLKDFEALQERFDSLCNKVNGIITTNTKENTDNG